jgi:hypothetical protein
MLKSFKAVLLLLICVSLVGCGGGSGKGSGFYIAGSKANSTTSAKMYSITKDVGTSNYVIRDKYFIFYGTARHSMIVNVYAVNGSGVLAADPIKWSSTDDPASPMISEYGDLPENYAEHLFTANKNGKITMTATNLKTNETDSATIYSVPENLLSEGKTVSFAEYDIFETTPLSSSEVDAKLISLNHLTFLFPYGCKPLNKKYAGDISLQDIVMLADSELTVPKQGDAGYATNYCLKDNWMVEGAGAWLLCYDSLGRTWAVFTQRLETSVSFAAYKIK